MTGPGATTTFEPNALRVILGLECPAAGTVHVLAASGPEGPKRSSVRGYRQRRLVAVIEQPPYLQGGRVAGSSEPTSWYWRP